MADTRKLVRRFPRRAVLITAALGLAILLPVDMRAQFAPAYQNLEFPVDLKGYSIEHETGQPGNGYVMAGTPVGGSLMAHFLAADQWGNILTSRTFQETDQITSPVDIVRSSVGTYYIICQARRKDPIVGLAEASIRVLEVGLAGNLIKNVRIALPAGNPLTDLYATHSLVHDGKLYICGWGDAPGSYPYEPNAGSGNKHGMVLCVNMNNVTLVNSRFWNSATPAASPSDFDMALRMRMSPNGHELLVTGAINRSHFEIGNQFPSYALALSLNPATLTSNWHHGISRPGAPTFEGRYGADIWRGSRGETYVLLNQDHANDPSDMRFGISVISPTGTLPTAFPNLHTFNSGTFWANQAITGSTVQWFNRLKVTGYMEGNWCGGPNPFGTQIPSFNNTVPFTADLTCSYDAGFQQLTSSLGPVLMQPTYGGTLSTSGYNFRQSGGFLSDVTRYYTSAIGEDYGANGVKGYTLTSPYINPTTTGLLDLKFNRLHDNGTQQLCDLYYDEECAIPTQDYPTAGAGNTDFGNHPVLLQAGGEIRLSGISYVQSDCGGPYNQRPANAGVSGVAGASSPALQTVSQDPVSEQVALHFISGASGHMPILIRVFNLQGQQVAAPQAIGNGGSRLTLSSSDLAPGLYQLQATVNGVRGKASSLVIR